MARLLRHDRAHDYRYLIRRWRSLARGAGLRLKKYADAGGCDLFFLESAKVKSGAASIYFSAGIHGDEAGATEGLLVWAEKNGALLREINALIFPCLNPWGLAGNCRLDSEGRDLNRGFRGEKIPQIVAQMRLLAGRRFDLALTLHEDYDARGLYLYEVPVRRKPWGEILLKAARRSIPTEARLKIEGRPARAGVIRRTIDLKAMPDWPEAFVLHLHHAERTFTVETPSEFFLDDRVRAQHAVIDKAVALCIKEFSLLKGPGKAS